MGFISSGLNPYLQAQRVVHLPQVAIRSVGVDPQLRRARRTVVVQLQPAMQRKPVLNIQDQRRGARLRAGPYFGQNLPVGVGIRPVQLRLKDVRVQECSLRSASDFT